MTDGERLEIYYVLLEKSINGELGKYYITEVFYLFSVFL